MKLKFDPAHFASFALLVLGIVGPGLFAKLSPDTSSAVAAYLSAAVAVLGQLLALAKASVIVPSDDPPSGTVGKSLAKLAGVAVLALAVLTSGCAWFKANEGALTSDAIQDGTCIVAQVEGGATSAVAIALTCGVPVVAQVESFVAAEIEALEVGTGTDAGPKVGAAHSAKFLEKLRKVH